MKTVSEFFKSNLTANACCVIKKGKRYVFDSNGEFGLTDSISKAIAFKSVAEVQRVVDVATIDDRNARVIGRSYVVAEALRRKPVN